MLKKTSLTAAALLPLAHAAAAHAAESATVQLSPLNSSGASGRAELLPDDAANMRTVNVDTPT